MFSFLVATDLPDPHSLRVDDGGKKAWTRRMGLSNVTKRQKTVV